MLFLRIAVIGIVSSIVNFASAQDIGDAQQPLQDYNSVFSQCFQDPDYQIDLGDPDYRNDKRRARDVTLAKGPRQSASGLVKRRDNTSLQKRSSWKLGPGAGLLKVIPYTIAGCYRLARAPWVVSLSDGTDNVANTKTFPVFEGLRYYFGYQFDQQIENVRVWTMDNEDNFKVLWELGGQAANAAAGWFFWFPEDTRVHIQYIFSNPGGGQSIQSNGYLEMDDWAAAA